jgi:hypothetical protein
MAEFAYNNSYHTAIETTPFLLNYGFEPLTPLTLQSENATDARAELAKLWHELEITDRCPAATRFSKEMHQRLADAKVALGAARQRAQRTANVHRTDIEFRQGEQVLLSTKNLNLAKNGCRKLLPRFIGPFEVTKVINAVACRLALPKELGRIHNVFHVSLLKKYTPGEEVYPSPPLPTIIDGEPEWQVDHILDMRTKGKKREYLIRWEGYGPSHDTWEPECNVLPGCKELVSEYRARIKTASNEKQPASNPTPRQPKSKKKSRGSSDGQRVTKRPKRVTGQRS